MRMAKAGPSKCGSDGRYSITITCDGRRRFPTTTVHGRPTGYRTTRAVTQRLCVPIPEPGGHDASNEDECGGAGIVERADLGGPRPECGSIIRLLQIAACERRDLPQRLLESLLHQGSGIRGDRAQGKWRGNLYGHRHGSRPARFLGTFHATERAFTLLNAMPSGGK